MDVKPLTEPDFLHIEASRVSHGLTTDNRVIVSDQNSDILHQPSSLHQGELAT
jgi:hypothetical protein